MADGPVLIFMSTLLDKPPSLWGIQSIGRNVEARKIVMPIVGAVASLPPALIFYALIWRNFFILMWSMCAGAGIAFFMTVANAPGGEKSVMAWIRVFISGQRGRITIDGQRVKVYLDLALLKDPDEGDYWVQPSTVAVNPENVNRDGLFIGG